MKCTNEQIKRLFQFTREHYVEYYDVQLELVDHLANGIEQQWEALPNLDFEEALSIEFKKFGVFGFMNILEERQKALSKKYYKIIWSHMKAYFRLPQIIGTLASVGIVFYGLRYSEITAQVVLWSAVVFLFAYLIYFTIKNKRTKSKTKKDDKKWLFKDMIVNQTTGFTLAFLPIHFYNIFFSTGSIQSIYNGNWIITLLIAVVLVLTLLNVYIMSFEIPEKAEEYIDSVYPEYRLVD